VVQNRVMTQESVWLKTAHRVHSGITVTILITLVILNLTGVLNSEMALRLFLIVEVPLLVVFVVITILRFKHLGLRIGSNNRSFLDRLEIEEPLLRPMVSELRAYQS